MPGKSATMLMASGGDRRIALDPRTGLNRYLVAPRPRGVMAYSSATANDISAPAFAEVQRRLVQIAPDHVIGADAYGEALDALRARIRAALRLPSSTGIVFAASGADLEYVGLAVGHRAGSLGINNVVLGADEAASGGREAARGAFFADRTALGVSVAPGALIHPTNKDFVSMLDIPVRGPGGVPVPSEDLLLEIGAVVEASIAARRHPLIHVVHGSKTGLILPSMAHIDALRRRFGNELSFVVDASQCRLGESTVAAYLARGATVLLTGSKFMGGPPFSGLALIPQAAAERSLGILPGFEQIFNRAEWPAEWAGASSLPLGANLGLLLRLEAAIYELELFQRLSPADTRRTLDLFDEAIDALTTRLGASRVAPYAAGQSQEANAYPLEMRTLVTLDLSQTEQRIDFERACLLRRMLHNDLRGRVRDPVTSAIAATAIRLGQPVKCVPLPNGGFGGTLHISLSMPQMVELAAMDTATLRSHFHDDMMTIATKIDIIGDL